MVAYNMQCSDNEKSYLDVSQVSKVLIDLLHEDFVKTVTQKYPDITTVDLAQSVTVNRIKYKTGTILVHGSCGCLPEFAEIMQLCLIRDTLSLIIRKLSSWHREHYCAFELHPMRELVDQYPLADHRVGSLQMVTLKRFIHITGNVFNV